MKIEQMYELFDTIVIRKLGGNYFASLETIKGPNTRYATIASSQGMLQTPNDALISLLKQEIKYCPECENRMEWANHQTRDGIEFLPQCPVCKKIGGELQSEGVMV